ncbi:MAG: hypothetical protein JXA66_04750, partial [Oligoflexia bacterium]|nr:hypothetical protein [Oligoflexia bacterium]
MESSFARKIVITFISKILLGVILLYCFGFSESYTGGRLMAAFFTSVSAVCVTGLTILDVSADFNLFGQAVLLFLVQIGGLGFLLVSNWIILYLRRRLSFNRTLISQDIMGSFLTIPVSSVLKRTILFTFSTELIGALVLYMRFIHQFSAPRAAWLAVFHSVSAFCNAGFSLFKEGFVSYSGDVVVNLTLVILIVLGGIGFVVVVDMMGWLKAFTKGSKRLLSYHSRVVIITTFILILSGFVF